MDEYIRANRELWNEITPIHEKSEFYDVDGLWRMEGDKIPLILSLKVVIPAV